MTIERGKVDPKSRARSARLHRQFQITRNELFWITVIRQAASDSDPEPNLDRVRQLRVIFRG